MGKIHAQLSWAWKKFYNLRPRLLISLPQKFTLTMSNSKVYIYWHHREYARGRRERRNRFRPADVAFFSSESDKNVALIFRKIRCFSIYISIYTRVISWYLTSGEVQHAIRLVYIKNRYVVEDPSGKAADVFPRKIRGIRWAHALCDDLRK